MDVRQEAARLRKELHDCCASGDVDGAREVLHEMYEDSDTPLHEFLQTSEGRPAAFAALVEVACLSAAHAALTPEDDTLLALSKEMETNLAVLRSGFDIDAATQRAIRKALRDCAAARTLEGAHVATIESMAGTQLEGKVRMLRHLVSFQPHQRHAAHVPERV